MGCQVKGRYPENIYGPAAMSYLPPIDEALVRVLAEQFPDVAPDIDWSDREIMFKAGQVSVVRWLRQKQLDQDTEMVSMQMEGN